VVIDLNLGSGMSIQPILSREPGADLVAHRGTRDYCYLLSRDGILSSIPVADLAYTGMNISKYSISSRPHANRYR